MLLILGKREGSGGKGALLLQKCFLLYFSFAFSHTGTGTGSCGSAFPFRGFVEDDGGWLFDG